MITKCGTFDDEYQKQRRKLTIRDMRRIQAIKYVARKCREYRQGYLIMKAALDEGAKMSGLTHEGLIESVGYWHGSYHTSRDILFHLTGARKYK